MIDNYTKLSPKCRFIPGSRLEIDSQKYPLSSHIVTNFTVYRLRRGERKKGFYFQSKLNVFNYSVTYNENFSSYTGECPCTIRVVADVCSRLSCSGCM